MGYHKDLAGSDLHEPSRLQVENNTAADITGLVGVKIVSQGTTYPEINKADGTIEDVDGITIGTVSAGGGTGYICREGLLKGINTTSWASGTKLYIDTSSSINTSPTSSHMIAKVLHQDAASGIIFVYNNAGSKEVVSNLSALSDVDFSTSAVESDVLTYSCGAWKPAAVGASSGEYSVSDKTASFTINTSEVTNNYIFTNNGATDTVKFTLPEASSGRNVIIINNAGQRIEIEAATGDDINGYNFLGLSSIYNDKQGSIVRLFAVDATSWYIINEEAWTDTAARGLFGGGNGPLNIIDYVTIASTGNATDFGDLTVARYGVSGVSSTIRGCFGGGNSGSSSNVIDYVTIASTGNATDFGDLTVARYNIAGCGSTTRGLFGGGYATTYSNIIDYITIASTGNATDFGDLVRQSLDIAGCGSATRGLFGGGYDGSRWNIIQYVTIASTGNATDFGDLTVARDSAGGASSSTRGLFAGGDTGTNSNIIDYVTIASTGNATDFGDLTVARSSLAGVSSSIRGCFGGGYSGSSSNIIDYITIASTGNATDFGDLTVVRYQNAGISNAHGGLA